MAEKWYSIRCTDCGDTVAFVTEPVEISTPIYCYLCAHSHSDIASLMRPIGECKLDNQGLYAVDTFDIAREARTEFYRVWKALFAFIEKHRIAKVKK